MSIINPIYFYLIELISNIQTLAFVIIAFSLLISFLTFLVNEKLNKKFIKIILIIFSVSSTIAVISPSKETMYKMMVAKYITYENVESAAEIIQDSVDYIFDKLDGGE